MKKLISVLAILAAIFVAAAPLVMADDSLGLIATDSGGKALKTIEVNAGQKVTSTIYFSIPGVPGKNPVPATDGFKSIELLTSTDVSTFPFDVTQSSYVVTNTNRFSFNMTCRKDAPSGLYIINFKVKTNDTEDIVPVYVKVTGSPNTGTPKITITGFSTNPDPVVAGEEISLSVTFKNNSSSATAENIKVQFSSDGTFNPVSGSSSMFIKSIGPGASSSISIKLKVKADAPPGSYSVSFNLAYEIRGSGESMGDTETVAIPVVQKPKIQVSQLQVYPEEAYVGQDINVMAQINNTGKSNLYNVSAEFKDKNGIFAEESQYIGNIEPGASGNIDVYLTAQREGEANIEMTITYENEDGEVFTHVETYSTYVFERGIIDPYPPPEPEPIPRSFGLWIILFMLLLAGGAVVLVVVLSKKKKDEEAKRRDQERVAQLEQQYYSEQTAGGAVAPAPVNTYREPAGPANTYREPAGPANTSFAAGIARPAPDEANQDNINTMAFDRVDDTESSTTTTTEV